MGLLNLLYACTFIFILKRSYAFQMSVDGSLLSCEEDSKLHSGPPYHKIEDCHRKIRLTLNITNTKKTPEGFLYLYVKEVGDPDTGVKTQLLNPIVLRLRQTQVILAYPFKYLSAVNGKASEVIAHYQNRKNFSGCDDTSYVRPTCGIKHERGVAVPFSEGFCCFCPESAVNVKQTRGGQDCSLDVNPSNFEEQKMKASAHCLRFSDIWYSVNALNDPLIFHDISIQVFNEIFLSNGSSTWVSLTHNEEFELGDKNPSQFDQNKTIVMTYITDSPKNGTHLISAENNRLLIPQPMPGLDLEKLPPPVKNGATDYLLVSKSVVSPGGKECDTAGVSYEGFATQPDRCNVVKNTCLKNQPLDLWEKDDEKRKSKKKGKYLLENYGTPYKDPIMINKETKEHWLAIEYYEEQQTVVTIEFKADQIVALTAGKHAQISHVVTASFEKKIFFFVTISNKDLTPAKFSVQALDCGYEVPDSNNASKIVPPQRRELFEIQTHPGKVELSDKFTCLVVVRNAEYGVVAKREILIKPLDRCICNMHCQCACLGESLVCKPMPQEEYHASGFQGSLPVLTAKPHPKPWILHHPLLVITAIVLVLFLLGFAKGIIGLMGFDEIANLGLESRVFQSKKIKSYLEPELQHLEVTYDPEGYPINPDTNERTRVLADEIIFAMNVVFFCIWPCLKVADSYTEDHKPPELPPIDYPDSDDGFDVYNDFTDDEDEDDEKGGESGSMYTVDLGTDHSGKSAELSGLGGPSYHTYENVPLSNATGRQFGRSGFNVYDNVPHEENTLPSSVTGRPFGQSGSHHVYGNVPNEEKEYDPVTPFNKELARWQKGSKKIHAFTK